MERAPGGGARWGAAEPLSGPLNFEVRDLASLATTCRLGRGLSDALMCVGTGLSARGVWGVCGIDHS